MHERHPRESALALPGVVAATSATHVQGNPGATRKEIRDKVAQSIKQEAGERERGEEITYIDKVGDCWDEVSGNKLDPNEVANKSIHT